MQPWKGSSPSACIVTIVEGVREARHRTVHQEWLYFWRAQNQTEASMALQGRPVVTSGICLLPPNRTLAPHRWVNCLSLLLCPQSLEEGLVHSRCSGRSWVNRVNIYSVCGTDWVIDLDSSPGFYILRYLTLYFFLLEKKEFTLEKLRALLTWSRSELNMQFGTEPSLAQPIPRFWARKKLSLFVVTWFWGRY